MRGAVRIKERWKGRRAPTQDPSTNTQESRRHGPVAVHPGALDVVALVDLARRLREVVGAHEEEHLRPIHAYRAALEDAQ